MSRILERRLPQDDCSPKNNQGCQKREAEMLQVRRSTEKKTLLNACCISFRRARQGLGSSGIDMLNSSRVGHIEDRGITAEPVCSAAIGQVPYWCRGHLLLVTKSPDRDCARQLQCLEDRFTSLTSSLFPAPIDFP